jgi:DNA-binding NtrC family response regulator
VTRSRDGLDLRKAALAFEERSGRGEKTIRLEVVVDHMERRMNEEAIRKSGGKKQKAAQALGLSRQWLTKTLKRYDIKF